MELKIDSTEHLQNYEQGDEDICVLRSRILLLVSTVFHRIDNIVDSIIL